MSAILKSVRVINDRNDRFGKTRANTWNSSKAFNFFISIAKSIKFRLNILEKGGCTVESLQFSIKLAFPEFFRISNLIDVDSKFTDRSKSFNCPALFAAKLMYVFAGEYCPN